MAEAQVNSAVLGTQLTSILMADDIQPGSDISYQLAKTIFTVHPLGRKMAETPVRKAQALAREITVGVGPQDQLREAFEKQWRADGFDEVACQTGTLARVYGLASVAMLVKDSDPKEPLDLAKLPEAEIAFNVLDPLNTAGSLVLNQDPNAFDFLKHRDISVQGQRYHRSRTVTLMNESPVYIEYTTSAFGFVGRSVYQRALYPLKSYISIMIADNMVARKVGLIVAALKQAGSIVDAIMNAAAAFKRRLLKVGTTDNVISVSEGETVTSLDLTNLDAPLEVARKHVLEDVATAADMPSKLLAQEAYVSGFGEGTEDAKAVADYVDGVRKWLAPLYDFFDMVAQRRAWNPKFYAALQEHYPEQYKNVSYEQAFYSWANSFKATWPSLLREPESEQVRVADTKLKGVIALAQVLLPELDPENRTTMIAWAAEEFSNLKQMFKTPLTLDLDALAAFKPAEAAPEEEEPKAAPPFSPRDSLAGYLASRPDDAGMRHRVTRIEDFLKVGRR